MIQGTKRDAKQQELTTKFNYSYFQSPHCPEVYRQYRKTRYF